MEFPLRVLIVDDHQMFREGIQRRLEQEPDIQVVGQASSAHEALEVIQKINPTVVVLDIRLPDVSGVSGIELARQIKERWPKIMILVLTGYDYDQYVRAMARIGVSGYVLKDAPQETLVQALREIASGGVALAPTVASKLMRSFSELSSHPRTGMFGELTVRELEVLEQMYQGLKNSEIAERLSISSRTIEAHVSNIINKLGAESRTEAVRLAVERGLVR